MKVLTGNMKPDIEYPCTWVFKLFVKDRDMLGEALPGIIPGREYTLTPSRSSRHKRYHCMNLELTVLSDGDRLSVYEGLNSHASILLVL
jgi:putative lipoic acid-binding regulatory protein